MKVRFSNSFDDVCFFSIEGADRESSYAIYQYDKKNKERVKIYNYQKSNVFKIELFDKTIYDYFFRIYAKKGDNRISNLYTPKEINFTENPNLFRSFWRYRQTETDLLNYLFVFGLNSEVLFKSFNIFKYGSLKMNDLNFHFLKKYSISTLYSNDYLYSFPVMFLIYFLDSAKLNELKEDILNKLNLFEDKRNYIFFKGVLCFRCLEFKESKRVFKHAIEFKKELRNYQTGAISYVDTDTLTTNYIEPKLNIVHEADLTGFSQIVLMSVDLGYLKAYFDETYKNSKRYNNMLHIHVILHNESYISYLDKDFYAKNNIGLSYEVIPLEGFSKSYYTTSRYLILNFFLKLYKKNIFIADIDLNINGNLNYLLDVFESNDIALFKTKKDLPWISYLAGMSYFGHEVADGYFVTKLREILSKLHSNGLDLWTVDQVALKLVVEDYGDSLIKDLKPHISYRQYNDRAQFRAIGSQFISNLKNI